MRNITRYWTTGALRPPCRRSLSAGLLMVCALVCAIILSGCQQYTCDNGTAQMGAPSASSIFCIACDDGYVLIDGACQQQGEYTCGNGTPIAGAPPGTNDVAQCERCDDGYVFDDSGATAICRDPIYSCPGGTPIEGVASGASRDVEGCTACDSGYHMFGERCHSVSKLVADDGAALDQFGFAVAINATGDRAIVGAYLYDDTENNSGSAYIFTRGETGWTQEAKITAADAEADDRFGFTVGINAAGNRVVIGAYFDDDTENNSGSAYIFTRGETGWTEEAKITAEDADNNDQFGITAAINGPGDRVVIGAYLDDDKGSASGSAYIFTRGETGWTQEAKVVASDGMASDAFGFVVAINGPGDRIIVGAYFDDDKGTNSGSAYIFTRSGTAWKQEAKMTAEDGVMGDRFGRAVAINTAGDRVVIGATRDDNNETDSGSAYIFDLSETVWTQQAIITAGDAEESAEFGRDVSINAVGDRVVIGAYLDNDIEDDSGSVYIFTRGETGWTEEAKITAADGAINDQFGIAVAINADGDRAVIGSHLDDDKGNNSGSAYIYDLP